MENTAGRVVVGVHRYNELVWFKSYERRERQNSGRNRSWCGFALNFQHFPRDLANFNEGKSHMIPLY